MQKNTVILIDIVATDDLDSNISVESFANPTSFIKNAMSEKEQRRNKDFAIKLGMQCFLKTQ